MWIRMDDSADLWLAQHCTRVAAGDATALAIAFGHAGRRHPDPAEARIRLVLALPATDPTVWLATLDRLFATAGMEELVALYRGLPRYPHADLLVARAAAGIRSSLETVFDAVALDNPYPAQWLGAGPFNQMVLKAFFLARDHRRILGLAGRVNPALGTMLAGYRRERVAASRVVPPGLDEVLAWCAALPARPPASTKGLP